MANFIRRGKNDQRDPNANFSISKEIAYWISKYNICPVEFKKTFDACGSVAKAIQLCLANPGIRSTIS
ncbi:MAG: hypothetical protein K0Q66_1948 [Chitinophagaceae bacterium]|jgi:hypothetical protein|nr:hypothetical protein [Chitinophagaceae bacterium]